MNDYPKCVCDGGMSESEINAMIDNVIGYRMKHHTGPGCKMWCSHDFYKELMDKGMIVFDEAGPHLKGHKEIIVFERRK